MRCRSVSSAGTLAVSHPPNSNHGLHDLQDSHDLHRIRLRAGRVSLAAGLLVFGGKFGAYLVTDSAAVFSDAMESVVNIAAAFVLLLSLGLAARPADRDHPYGHGKVEFFSAGIEGAFLLVAAVLIFIEAIGVFLVGPSLRELDVGLGLLAVFGGLNAVLGGYLVRVGERTKSVALIADGRHVLADVWTTAGVLVGLGAVWATGWSLLDPLVAIVVALHIVREGGKLLRRAVRGLMDEADEELLERIVAALATGRGPEWVDVHGLRSRNSGAAVHTDMHLIVPRYFDVQLLHSVHEAVESTVAAATETDSETVVHFDPCEPSDCAGCAMGKCPVRSADLERRYALTLDRAMRRDEMARVG